MTFCLIDDCDREAVARGCCLMHYKRFRARGALPPRVGHKPSKVTAWLEAAAKHEGDDCLIWPFARDHNGYGVRVTKGHTQTASRAICLLAHGEPPTPKHHAAHTCNAGHLGCVNPRHLTWKTAKENAADKFGAGTQPLGETHYKAKLTAEQIRQMRDEIAAGDQPVTVIARKYGLHPGSAYGIRDRKRWAHV
jgi:hypothetical protein